MKRLFVLLMLVTYAFGGLTPNPPELKKIEQSVGMRNYATAVAHLQSLKASDEKTFADRDYEYLLGRMAEANGELATAMSSYQRVANSQSLLSIYALKRLSFIARSTGNLILERIYLNEILIYSPDSRIADSAILRLARNNFESGNYAETIRILSGEGRRSSSRSFVVKKPADNAGLRELRALLAEAFSRIGQPDRARKIFTNLLDTSPNVAQPDDHALAAAKGLDLLDVRSDNSGKKVEKLAEAEHLRRANIYQFNRNFADAKLHFDAVIDTYQGSVNTAESVLQIGRGYAQQMDYVEALKWFERVNEQYPQTAFAKDALLQAASAYGRVGRPREAMTRYQSFIEKFPSDERLDRAYLNIVDILRDQGEDTDALKWCKEIRELFRGRLPETIALFTEVRVYLAREEWHKALDSLDRLRLHSELGGSAVPGGTSVNEITFLRAYVLEELKKYPEAIETYLSIPDGRGEYYGSRATERLRLLGSDETAKSHIRQMVGLLSVDLRANEADTRRKSAQSILRLTDSDDLRERYLSVLKMALESLPKYKEIPDLRPINNTGLHAAHEIKDRDIPGQDIASRLLSLGLYDEAYELKFADPAFSRLSFDSAFVMASHLKRSDRADHTMAFIEPLWRKVPADYPIELIPRDQLEMLYPAPFVDELLRSTEERRVDPRLMLAIMRQESRFQPDAKSYAAARGLMQFIATTSNRVANQVGRDNFRQDELYDPATSILLGSHYLADLFEIFPNQPDAIASSYNGGEDNMKRWLNRARSNQPERYVPEIVYAQSKDYVHKVMASYRMYQFLYDDVLRPR